MQIIENSKIKEKLYVEKLNNGLTIMVIPKKVRKKYMIWGTNFGSIDNKFLIEGEENITKVPDGIAHYLEHKLFEQENGKNSLDVLSSLGVDANAYTTNNHTSFLFESTDYFYEALDEFMNYVQNPYFTDENVEKERGIIGQEIMMYEDYPEWAIYMNAIKCMYAHNEINVDIAGTQESIAEIDKEKLYTIYHSFYRPENMIIVVAGDFVIEDIIKEIKSRITLKPSENTIRRIYNDEPEEIVQKRIEKNMDISMPCFMIGFKDVNKDENKVRRDIALNISCSILFGTSSSFYQKLYEQGKILSEPSVSYEFAPNYAHLLIQCQTDFVDDVVQEMDNRIQEIKEKGIDEEEFKVTKRKIYGEFVKDYNNISTIANSFVANFFRNINSFEYFEEFESIHKEYVEKVLNEVFDKEKKVVSVINPNKEE